MTKVVIVAHDAGGGEILSAWVSKHRDLYDFQLCVAGPSRKIFERDFGDLEIHDLSAIHRLGGEDFVLTGSSLEADLERQAILTARDRGVRSIAFLDHWDLFAERYGSVASFDTTLPDEIWVGDEYGRAFAIAEGFPEGKLKQVPNPYFEKIRRIGFEALASSPPVPNDILYVCEPLSIKLETTYGQDATRYDDETTIMRKFLEASLRHRSRIRRLTLRLHPRETEKKYAAIVEPFRSQLPLRFSQAESLIEVVAQHGAVVGIESMGLVVGVLLEKPVYSCVTGMPWTISLPHTEIERAASFDEVFKAIPVAANA